MPVLVAGLQDAGGASTMLFKDRIAGCPSTGGLAHYCSKARCFTLFSPGSELQAYRIIAAYGT